MKKHKHRKMERRPDITISPASNGFVINIYDRQKDVEPLIFADLEGVLQYLIETFAS